MSPIRSVTKNDLPALKAIVDDSGLFSSVLLESIIRDYFTNPNTTDVWLTKEAEGVPAVLAFYAPEKYINETYIRNLLAVRQQFRGNGLAGEMMDHIENGLRLKAARLLVLETTSLPEFEPARGFYERRNFQRVGLVPHFYNEREDKILFWKRLRPE